MDYHGSLIVVIACLHVLIGISVGASLPIGLVMENDKLAEISAVTYAVQFANTHIMTTDSLVLKTRTFDPMSATGAIQATCNVTADSVIAQIGPASKRHISIISPILGRLNVPLISTRGLHSPVWSKSSANLTLYLRPPDEYRGKAIATIMKRMVWRRVHILTSDDYYGQFGMRALLEASSVEGWFIVSTLYFKSSLTASNITSQLNAIKFSGYRVTILNCKYWQAKIILDTAQAQGMTGLGWVWILTDDFTDPNSMVLTPPVAPHLLGLIALGRNSVVGGLGTQFQSDWLALNTSTYPGSGSPLPVSIGMWVDAVFAIAYAIRDYAGVVSPSVGLSCTGTTTYTMGRTIMDQLKMVNQSGISHIGFNETFPDDVGFEVYNSRPSGWKKVAMLDQGTIYKPMGAERILLPGNVSVAPDMVSSINGRHLKCVSIVVAPYNYFINGSKPADPNNVDLVKDKFGGIVIDMYNEMARTLNFTFSLYMVADGQFGARNPNTGVWSGMVGEILAGKADMVCSPMAISRARLEVIEYSRSVFDSGYNFVLPKTKKVVDSWSFMKVFSPQVWIYIGLTIIAVGLAVALLDKTSPYGNRMEFAQTAHDMERANMSWRNRRIFYRYRKETINLLDVSNSIWFSLASTIQQGYEVQPNPLSARFVTCCWWLGILVLTSLYTAQLGAVLISARMQTEINSLEDLAAQDHVQYGAPAGSNMVSVICDTDLPVYKALCKYMKKTGTIIPGGEAIARVMDPNDQFAMIHADGAVNSFIEKKPCELRKLPQIFYTQGFGLGLPKNSPYADIISLTVQQMREVGYIDDLEAKWFNPTKCAGSTEDMSEVEKNQQKLRDIKGVWIVIVVCAMTSPALLVLENVYYYYEKSRRFSKGGNSVGLCSAMGSGFSRMSSDLIANTIPEFCISHDSKYGRQHRREIAIANAKLRRKARQKL